MTYNLLNLVVFRFSEKLYISRHKKIYVIISGCTLLEYSLKHQNLSSSLRQIGEHKYYNLKLYGLEYNPSFS